MKSKKLKHLIAIYITVSIIEAMSPLPVSAEWVQDSQNNWSFYENGNATTGWKQVDGTWYYFDDNGNMKTGWVLATDSKWYYLNSDGSMKTGWLQDIDKKWYNLGTNGAMKTGWVQYNNEWYNMDSSGAMRTGWIQEADGKMYFASISGVMQTGVIEVAGNEYAFDNNGEMLIGNNVICEGNSYKTDAVGVIIWEQSSSGGSSEVNKFTKEGVPIIPTTTSNLGTGTTVATDTTATTTDSSSSSSASISASTINVIGTAKVGVELTASALTLGAATVSYQWKICNTVNGTYTDINGATTNKYTPIASDVGKFIKVAVTGTGSYSGTIISEATVEVEAAPAVKTPITAIAGITETPQVGVELTAGGLNPAEATASYQWQICDTSDGTYTDISGEITNKYTPVASDAGKFIKVVATGTGGYSGTATSVATTAVVKTPITAIAAITGTPQVGVELTAGSLSPAEATASYQWKICDTADGTYTDISGETINQYTPIASDIGKFIKVVATGTGGYSGTATSVATTAVVKTPITAIAAITGTPQVGVELTAGGLDPAEATASYQWQICDTADGTYTGISGETINKYTPIASDVGKFIKVAVTGTGSYSGTVTSVATTAVVKTPITAITVTPQVGATLTAEGLDPAGATASYKWQISNFADGPYTDIYNAIGKTLNLKPTQADKYIRVVATGTGGYCDTVTSASRKTKLNS